MESGFTKNGYAVYADSAAGGLYLNKRKIKRSTGEMTFDIANVIFMLLLCVIMIYPFWYVLILALPVLYGAPAVKQAIVMALTGALGVAVYALLKRLFVRERPFITHDAISLAAAPIDRYSFPSGHTLHAVSFTWQACAHFPELGWVLVPLAALIAGSRVVLGLHYPSDVLAGAAIGGALAELGLACT